MVLMSGMGVGPETYLKNESSQDSGVAANATIEEVVIPFPKHLNNSNF